MVNIILGFYTVEEVEYTVRLYRIHEAANGIHLEVDYQNKTIYKQCLGFI